jgi:short subunit fatty acids transporter
MDKFLEFLNGFNIQTILSLVAIVWYATHHMESKMEKIEEKLIAQEEKLVSQIAIQSARSDQLYQMFIELLKQK